MIDITSRSGNSLGCKPRAIYSYGYNIVGQEVTLLLRTLPFSPSVFHPYSVVKVSLLTSLLQVHYFFLSLFLLTGALRCVVNDGFWSEGEGEGWVGEKGNADRLLGCVDFQSLHLGPHL